ncbi:MAG: AMP-binding protein [Candidatus Wallbacteria bacterium]|nr:AMP-binding protein [Candidatus Wallbacteria bacterium]
MSDTLENKIIHSGQYNIGYICSRLQCEQGLRDKTAMKWISPSMEMREISFGELEIESNRFANALNSLNVVSGERVFIFLPKVPELFFSFLGILKKRAVAGTLFPNFGEDALKDRLFDSEASILITKKSQLKKIEKIWKMLPTLRTIILVDANSHVSDTVLSYKLLTGSEKNDFNIEMTGPDTPSVMHYTSGSTGKPKGVIHVHKSILSQHFTTKSILQLEPDDIFWCTADQGWVTGTSYGIIGPWSCGITQIHYGGAYSPEIWMKIIEQFKVSVWYTAPTALRMLKREPDDLFYGFNFSELRSIFSVGEPLNPEVFLWGKRVFKKDIYDTWFQTETGSIMVSNRPGLIAKPGSMGKPVEGIDARVLSDEGVECLIGSKGNLCMKPGWSSMFAGYNKADEVYQNKFKNGFYFSGDLAHIDEEGYFWFSSRSDDVINTAGHLISPFEVESALLEIPDVADTAVIGAPDDLLWEKVVAYLVLKPGIEWNNELELKIRLHVSNRVSSIATPQDIKIISKIPKNKSGKIMRRVLKSMYLGNDLGDLSTMEDEA